MFQTMIEHMPENMKNLAVKGLEALKNGKNIISIGFIRRNAEGYARLFR